MEEYKIFLIKYRKITIKSPTETQNIYTDLLYHEHSLLG